MKWLALKLITFYKRHISAIINADCKYIPTCSVYTYAAVEKYGFFIGCHKGFWRIMRCNPFAKGGYEPVRENLRGNAKWLL